MKGKENSDVLKSGRSFPLTRASRSAILFCLVMQLNVFTRLGYNLFNTNRNC